MGRDRLTVNRSLCAAKTSGRHATLLFIYCYLRGTRQGDAISTRLAAEHLTSGTRIVQWERDWERILLVAARRCSAVLAPARF